MIELLHTPPPSVNNYWQGGGSRRYISKRGVLFKRALALLAKQSKTKLHKGEVALCIEWHKKDKRKKDIDNILKPILDALIGVAYFDDSQVVELNVKKIPSDIECLKIEVKERII